MKRYNLGLEDEIHRRLKAIAARQGVSIGEVIKSALRPTVGKAYIPQAGHIPPWFVCIAPDDQTEALDERIDRLLTVPPQE